MAATTRPGAAIGITMRSSTPSGEQPSIIAASSTSSGTSTKKPIRSQIENGSANETYAISNPVYVSSSPSRCIIK